MLDAVTTGISPTQKNTQGQFAYATHGLCCKDARGNTGSYKHTRCKFQRREKKYGFLLPSNTAASVLQRETFRRHTYELIVVMMPFNICKDAKGGGGMAAPHSRTDGDGVEIYNFTATFYAIKRNVFLLQVFVTIDCLVESAYQQKYCS